MVSIILIIVIFVRGVVSRLRVLLIININDHKLTPISPKWNEFLNMAFFLIIEVLFTIHEYLFGISATIIDEINKFSNFGTNKITTSST
jgi:hypothetical protein